MRNETRESPGNLGIESVCAALEERAPSLLFERLRFLRTELPVKVDGTAWISPGLMHV